MRAEAVELGFAGAGLEILLAHHLCASSSQAHGFAHATHAQGLDQPPVAPLQGGFGVGVAPQDHQHQLGAGAGRRGECGTFGELSGSIQVPLIPSCDRGLEQEGTVLDGLCHRVELCAQVLTVGLAVDGHHRREGLLEHTAWG